MTLLRQLAVTAFIGAVLPTAALAGAWEMEPSVTGSVRYNDNPTLQPKSLDPQSVSSTFINAQAEFSWLEPDATLVLTPQVKQTWYMGDTNLPDTTDYFFRGSYNKTRPKWAWGLSARYDYQSVLSSEDISIDDPGDTGSGNFLRVDDERELYSISPSISWTPTRKDTVLLGVSASRTDYELDFTNRADVDSVSGSLSYDRLLTERQSVGLIATAYQSESVRRGFILVCPDDTLPDNCPQIPPDLLFLSDAFFNNDSDGFSFSLSYGYSWSENFRLKASFGRQETTVESSINVPNDSLVSESTFKSNQYNIGFVGKTERLDYDVTLSRSVQPASNGAPADKTQIALLLDYRITQRFIARLEAIGYEQEARSAFTVRTNRFVRTDANLIYRFKENWNLVLGYTFRNRDPQLLQLEDQDENNNLEDANARRKSNQLTLSTRYKFR